MKCEKHTGWRVPSQLDEHTPVHSAQTEPGAEQRGAAYRRGPQGDKVSPFPSHNETPTSTKDTQTCTQGDGNDMGR